MSYINHVSIDNTTHDVQDLEAVSYTGSQTLTDAQKQQARDNIDAADKQINSSIAPVDTSPTQSSHVKNSLFVANSTLYKANDAIAPGDVILPGTNVIETNVAQLLTPITLTASTGDIVSVSSTYAVLGTTDARLYVYPFGLAILKGYFRIVQDPGATERVFARISVGPLHWFGQTAISQQGTTCAIFIRANGTIGVTSSTSNSLGTYHFIVTFPIAPYIT